MPCTTSLVGSHLHFRQTSATTSSKWSVPKMSQASQFAQPEGRGKGRKEKRNLTEKENEGTLRQGSCTYDVCRGKADDTVDRFHECDGGRVIKDSKGTSYVHWWPLPSLRQGDKGRWPNMRWRKSPRERAMSQTDVTADVAHCIVINYMDDCIHILGIHAIRPWCYHHMGTSKLPVATIHLK